MKASPGDGNARFATFSLRMFATRFRTSETLDIAALTQLDCTGNTSFEPLYDRVEVSASPVAFNDALQVTRADHEARLDLLHGVKQLEKVAFGVNDMRCAD